MLKNKSRDGMVTLLYAAKDTEHNNALVLRDYLQNHNPTPETQP